MTKLLWSPVEKFSLFESREKKKEKAKSVGYYVFIYK